MHVILMGLLLVCRNYVVQNVLSLKTERVSDGIAWRLEGKCVELAKQLGGSYIVEKCIEASELGMVCVVREIVGTPKAAMELAQDIFGNHVIQTALKKTKVHQLLLLLTNQFFTTIFNHPLFFVLCCV